MRAYLTEWLILYGTGWIDGEVVLYSSLWSRAKDSGYIEYISISELLPFAGCERITPKGLEYIKDEQT